MGTVTILDPIESLATTSKLFCDSSRLYANDSSLLALVSEARNEDRKVFFPLQEPTNEVSVARILLSPEYSKRRVV